MDPGTILSQLKVEQILHAARRAVGLHLLTAAPGSASGVGFRASRRPSSGLFSLLFLLSCSADLCRSLQVQDQVAAQFLLMDHLGISKVHACVAGSAQRRIVLTRLCFVPNRLAPPWEVRL